MKKKDKDLEGGQQLPCTLRNMDLKNVHKKSLPGKEVNTCT